MNSVEAGDTPRRRFENKRIKANSGGFSTRPSEHPYFELRIRVDLETQITIG